MRALRPLQALAADALVARGFEVDGLDLAGPDPACLTLRQGGRQVELQLASLARVLAMLPPQDHPPRIEAWARAVEQALRARPAEGELVPRLLPTADPRLWTAPLGPGLHLALAWDQPEHQRLLSPFDLPRLGLSLAEARRRALAALQARSAAPEPLPGLPAFAWALGDGLDAARLLLLGRAPGALAVIPARDLCWWVPADQPDAPALARHLLAEAHGLGPLPYPLSDRIWWAHPAGLEAL